MIARLLTAGPVSVQASIEVTEACPATATEPHDRTVSGRARRGPIILRRLFRAVLHWTARVPTLARRMGKVL